MMQTIDGVLWNYAATSNYLMELYANEKIIRNSAPINVDQHTNIFHNNYPHLQNDSPSIPHNVISLLQGTVKIKQDPNTSNANMIVMK